MHPTLSLPYFPHCVGLGQAGGVGNQAWVLHRQDIHSGLLEPYPWYLEDTLEMILLQFSGNILILLHQLIIPPLRTPLSPPLGLPHSARVLWPLAGDLRQLLDGRYLILNWGNTFSPHYWEKGCRVKWSQTKQQFAFIPWHSTSLLPCRSYTSVLGIMQTPGNIGQTL